MMRSVFQTILYRVFRDKRGDLSVFKNAIDFLAFNKEENCLLGLIMKSILLRTSLTKGYHLFNGSITEEFPFVTMEEIRESLKDGCIVWLKLISIKELIKSRAPTKITLIGHFETA